MKAYVVCSLFAGALLFAGCGYRPADGEAKIGNLVIALKPDRNPDAMLEDKHLLENMLGERLGIPVEVIIPLTSSVIQEGFVNGTIDIAYLSATDMVNARERRSAEILLAGEINGKTYYTSYWVTLRDKPYASVVDLAGKAVAFSSRTSTSGFVIPVWDLSKRGLVDLQGGLESFFGRGNSWFGIGYVSAVERVLNGDAEAAAVSYYVFDEDRHLSREQRDRLKVMAEQGPVPTHVIAVRSNLSPQLKDILRQTFLELNNEGHRGLRDRLFTSALVEVDPDEHVADIRQAIDFARQLNIR